MQQSLLSRIIFGIMEAFTAVIIGAFSVVGAIFGRAVVEIIGIILVIGLIMLAGAGS